MTACARILCVMLLCLGGFHLGTSPAEAAGVERCLRWDSPRKGSVRNYCKDDVVVRWGKREAVVRAEESLEGVSRGRGKVIACYVERSEIVVDRRGRAYCGRRKAPYRDATELAIERDPAKNGCSVVRNTCESKCMPNDSSALYRSCSAYCVEARKFCSKLDDRSFRPTVADWQPSKTALARFDAEMDKAKKEYEAKARELAAKPVPAPSKPPAAEAFAPTSPYCTPSRFALRCNGATPCVERAVAACRSTFESMRNAP